MRLWLDQRLFVLWDPLLYYHLFICLRSDTGCGLMIELWTPHVLCRLCLSFFRLHFWYPPLLLVMPITWVTLCIVFPWSSLLESSLLSNFALSLLPRFVLDIRWILVPMPNSNVCGRPCSWVSISLRNSFSHPLMCCAAFVYIGLDQHVYILTP